MKLLKADNYQTWFIEEAGQGVLIDPWLSSSSSQTALFLFKGKEIKQAF